MTEKEKEFVEIPREEIPTEETLPGVKETVGSEDNPWIFDFTNKRIRKVPTIQTYGVDIPQAATKGDLIVGDGSYSQDLVVGSDNQALVADSSQTLGVKWGDVVNSVSAGTGISVSGNTGSVTISKSSSIEKFGGTGADGALLISSGTTNIDLGGASVFVKNYTSISITGTGALTFSNPHNNGTNIVLKSIGDVTITTSATAINIDSVGALGGSGGAASGGNQAMGGGGGGGASSVAWGGSSGLGSFSTQWGNPGQQGYDGIGLVSFNGGGIGGESCYQQPTDVRYIIFGVWKTARPCNNIYGIAPTIKGKAINIAPGSGGGGGGSGQTYPGGAGGRGGGALYIECVGTLNVSSTFSGLGAAGSNSGGTYQYGGGGGGGGGGTVVIVANSIGTNTPTFTMTGGALGTGGIGGATQGADGTGVVLSNTEFV